MISFQSIQLYVFDGGSCHREDSSFGQMSEEDAVVAAVGQWENLNNEPIDRIEVETKSVRVSDQSFQNRIEVRLWVQKWAKA